MQKLLRRIMLTDRLLLSLQKTKKKKQAKTYLKSYKISLYYTREQYKAIRTVLRPSLQSAPPAQQSKIDYSILGVIFRDSFFAVDLFLSLVSYHYNRIIRASGHIGYSTSRGCFTSLAFDYDHRVGIVFGIYATRTRNVRTIRVAVQAMFEYRSPYSKFHSASETLRKVHGGLPFLLV